MNYNYNRNDYYFLYEFIIMYVIIFYIFILRVNIKEKNQKTEICNECGRDVSPGTELFVNRIFDLSDDNYRKEMGKPFFKGDFICAECESDIEKEFERFNTLNK
ncbi:MAG: hypothetical protein JW917_00190 [Ignavibacteria bacterium]|nr:hypothetical protein [Ignavibacteria bacterium]